MTASLSTTLALAFGLTLGSSLSALAESNSLGPVAQQDAGAAADTPQSAPGQNTGPDTAMKQRPAVRKESEKKAGLSRNKSDCVKTGCVDSGGN